MLKQQVLLKYSIISDLKELPEIKWSYPTDKEILKEIDTESALESLLLINAVGWPKREEYTEAVSILKEVSKPEHLDPKALKGNHIWKSYEDLVKTVKSFGGPKDPESMLQAIRTKKALPMPIVVRKKDGEMRILGGCTRSGIAALANQKITALVLDEKAANENLADRLEKAGEVEAKEEGKKDIYDKVKAYCLSDSAKPTFSEEDEFPAHIAEYRYHRIAKLRGLPEREWLYSGWRRKR